MKKPKYIYGDLVRHESYQTYKVTDIGSILDDCCYTLENLQDGSSHFISSCGVKPIFLTSEILKKNGYKPVINKNYIYQHISDNCYELWKLDGKGWVMYWRGQKLRTFKYVHEFQHLLFGLGLDNDLKV